MKHFKAGEVIYDEGEPGNDAWVLEQGEVVSSLRKAIEQQNVPPSRLRGCRSLPTADSRCLPLHSSLI